MWKTLTKWGVGRRVITREVRIEVTIVRKKGVVMCRGSEGSTGKTS